MRINLIFERLFRNELVMELEDKEELKISLFFEPRYCHDVSIKLKR